MNFSILYFVSLAWYARCSTCQTSAKNYKVKNTGLKKLVIYFSHPFLLLNDVLIYFELCWGKLDLTFTFFISWLLKGFQFRFYHQWVWSFKPQKWLRYRSESDQNFHFQILALDLGRNIRTKILSWISDSVARLRVMTRIPCFWSLARVKNFGSVLWHEPPKTPCF